ncbi:right-handed parallel beta-helix repeat-containing protein [Marinimicrobium alkaliphilum]|uniref:right-handed parallel beta-helix repeat-containing protein n=1 Tax=Marinimicrobium alkaliphilum TaxID=2202654 RepID=UPI000DBA0061|nr:right-handed parallel beta-helix repeat-containing protein [Marinimicrobium alkaliphilum]
MKALAQSTILLALALLLVGCGSSSSDPVGETPGNGNGNGNSNGSGNGEEPPVTVELDPFDSGLHLIPNPPPEPTPHDSIPDGENVFFVAPDGSDNNPGTEEQPLRSIPLAVEMVGPGDVIVLRGGVYHEDDTVNIRGVDGTAEARITLINYPGETPILDFSAQESGRGLRLWGDYWNIVGVKVRYAAHNGINIEGNHIRLERCVSYGNEDTGVHISGYGSYNLVMNCDSYKNVNARDPVGNRADGFTAKGDRLGAGNMFYGNRAWNNSDDGFDFWESDSTIILYNNWAFDNGNPDVFEYREDLLERLDMTFAEFQSAFTGGGNGFKLGRTDENGNHVVYRNMAFDNTRGNAHKGFDQNSNSGTILLVNNTAYNNGRNFAFSGRNVLANNLALVGIHDVGGANTQVTNSWDLDDVTIDESHFVSTDTSLALEPRNPDGSLPDTDLFKLAPGSALINAGTDPQEGLPFNGSAPDIGAREFSE